MHNADCPAYSLLCPYRSDAVAAFHAKRFLQQETCIELRGQLHDHADFASAQGAGRG